MEGSPAKQSARSYPHLGFNDFVEQNFTSAYRFAFCLSLAHDRAARIVEAAFHEAKALQETEATVDKIWVLERLHQKWRACHPARFDPEVEQNSDRPSIRVGDAAGMECDAVLKILHSMNPAYRLVLSLFYFEQLGANAIGRILELPPATVVSRLAEAKVLLRQLLEQTRHTPSAASA
ncbi:hypothetical protein BH20VER1_BH20VER1_14180 [soil metagenome]